VKTNLPLAVTGILIFVFGADLQRGCERIDMRHRIVERWNQNEPDEQFSTSGIVSQDIHITLRGELSGDERDILKGLITSPGLVDELVRDGFDSIECGGRVVVLRNLQSKQSDHPREVTHSSRELKS
jgi:hypothetical protein